MAPDASDALAVREKVQTFLNAVCIGDFDLFKKIAQQLDDGKGIAQTVVDVKDGNKRGALHFAAREGQIEVCKYLIEELKIDVNTIDEDGETPLTHAARQRHTDTAKYLIQHGADPSIQSELKTTALHHSAGIGDVELLELLLAKSVDVNLQSDAGTPLIWAAGNAQPDVPNLKTEDDITSLLTAVAAGSSTCVELLIKAGADVNVTAGGATPLHIAADGGSVEILNSLLQAGADANVIDENELKPVQVAAANGHRTAVEILFPISTQVPEIRDNKGAPEEFPKPRDTMPEVTAEAKTKAAEAKKRADQAFRRKDLMNAIDAYTQAIDLDSSDAFLLSNRSLCWILLGQAEHALADARACKALRPDWAKACYREGAAHRLLQKFEEAATAF